MADEVIKELWAIKDEMAGEYGYDLNALVDALRKKKHREDQRILDLRSLRRNSKSGTKGMGTPTPLQQSP